MNITQNHKKYEYQTHAAPKYDVLYICYILIIHSFSEDFCVLFHDKTIKIWGKT